MEELVSLASSGTFCETVFEYAIKQLASETHQAGKTAAKDTGMKAIDVCKIVAIDAGKKLVEKTAKNYPHPNRKWLMLWFTRRNY